MQDVFAILNDLKRPRLMMRAARIGAEEYSRSVHLPRLLGYGKLPRHTQALMQLINLEVELEAQRTSSDAEYRVTRHIDVLIAVVAEARDLRATRADHFPKTVTRLT